MREFKVNQFCTDHDILHAESRIVEDLLRDLGKTSVDDKSGGIAQFTLSFAEVTLGELVHQIKNMRLTSRVDVSEIQKERGETSHVGDQFEEQII